MAANIVYTPNNVTVVPGYLSNLTIKWTILIPSTVFKLPSGGKYDTAGPVYIMFPQDDSEKNNVF